MNWKYIKPLKNCDAVKEYEKTCEFVFPDCFKDLVLKYNGARPEMCIYDTSKAKERTIKSLLSFNKDDKINIWKVTDWVDKELKDKYVIFAIDNFGNYICFSKKDNSIQFIEHETLDTELISDDFSSFLKKLYSLE